MEFEGRARIREQLSMAPLIDVVFLLLLFFMLTSSFRDPEAVDLALPQSRTSTPSEDALIRVAVDGNGVVHLDGQALAPGGLESALAPLLAADPETTVSLASDAGLPVQTLLDVIDDIRSAGGSRLALVTEHTLPTTASAPTP